MRRPLVCVLMPAAVLPSLGCAEGKRSELESERDGALEPGMVVPDQALVRDLRQGGYVIYLCNAAEPKGADGPENLGIRDARRNLSEEGRTQAAMIGEAYPRARDPCGGSALESIRSGLGHRPDRLRSRRARRGAARFALEQERPASAAPGGSTKAIVHPRREPIPSWSAMPPTRWSMPGFPSTKEKLRCSSRYGTTSS